MNEDMTRMKKEKNDTNLLDRGFQPVAGQPINIEWKPTAGKTVTLVLRSGSSTNLREGTPIIEKAANTGNFTWNVDKNTVRGADYTIEIINDDDTSETNYFPYFVLDSTVVVASTTTSLYTYGAPTGTSYGNIQKTKATATAAAMSASTTADADADASGADAVYLSGGLAAAFAAAAAMIAL